MESYIGMGSGASSFINGKHTNYDDIRRHIDMSDNVDGGSSGIRWSNTMVIGEYLKGQSINQDSLIALSDKDFLIEEFFL